VKTIEFIKKARNKHGYFYQYLEVNNPMSRDVIKILCPKHGKFSQVVNDHLQGSGCTRCGHESISSSRVKSPEKFKEDANRVHNNTYDYSQVNYKKGRDEIKIICLEHGPFKQRAENHLEGNGCPKCGDKRVSALSTYDFSVFLEKAKEVHGDLYDYSKVKYVSTQNKIEVVCISHGTFIQRASSHLGGSGCPTCFSDLRWETSPEIKTKLYIGKAEKVHGDKYTYQNVAYEGSKIKVVVTCSKHGDFKIHPNNHLSGRGCKECSKEIQNRGVSLFASWGCARIEEHFQEHGSKPSRCYLLSFYYGGRHCYKVGITNNDVKTRVGHIKRRSSDGEVFVVREVKLNYQESFYMEQRVLKDFSEIGEVIGGGFRGHTETFYIPESPEILKMFLSHLPTT